jgi:hypothetical protein
MLYHHDVINVHFSLSLSVQIEIHNVVIQVQMLIHYDVFHVEMIIHNDASQQNK